MVGWNLHAFEQGVFGLYFIVTYRISIYSLLLFGTVREVFEAHFLSRDHLNGLPLFHHPALGYLDLPSL
jgi:hypothetical protein